MLTVHMAEGTTGGQAVLISEPQQHGYVPPPPPGTGIALLCVGLAIALAAIAAVAGQRWSGGSGHADRQSGRTGRWFVGLGIALACMGAGLLGIRYWADQGVTDGLQEAGQQVIGQAVQAAQECGTLPTMGPIPMPGGGVMTPPPCRTNPRGAFAGSGLDAPEPIVNSHGVYGVRLADSYATSGQVQITDTDTGRTVCVTLPATTAGSGGITNGPCTS